MKALAWHARGDVRYDEIPEPSPGPGQAKVKIHYTGICGSDLHEYEIGPVFISFDPHPLTGTVPPITLGHEFSGRVVEIGKGVTSLKVGDRVTGDCMWVCGECYYCTRNMPSLCVKAAFTGLSVNGSMAEYMVAPDYSFYKIPDAVPDDLAALVEPFEVAFHAIRQGQLMIGDTVAIVGAGPIGDIVQIAAKAAGASKVFQIEPSKKRREIAKDLGADFVFDPTAGDPAQQIMDVNGGAKADVVFECVGNAAAPITALAVTRNAGTMVLVGIYGQPSPTMHFGDPSFGQKKIIGSLAYSREATMVLDLLADGRIDSKKAQKLITGRIALKDTVEKGFKELIHNKEQNLKILVESPNWS